MSSLFFKNRMMYHYIVHFITFNKTVQKTLFSRTLYITVKKTFFHVESRNYKTIQKRFITSHKIVEKNFFPYRLHNLQIRSENSFPHWIYNFLTGWLHKKYF